MTTLNTPHPDAVPGHPEVVGPLRPERGRTYRAFCWPMPGKLARLRADGVWQNTVTTRHWHGGRYNFGWTDSAKVNRALLEFLVSTDSLEGGRQ